MSQDWKWQAASLHIAKIVQFIRHDFYSISTIHNLNEGHKFPRLNCSSSLLRFTLINKIIRILIIVTFLDYYSEEFINTFVSIIQHDPVVT